jgi:hypothetical protein
MMNYQNGFVSGSTAFATQNTNNNEVSKSNITGISLTKDDKLRVSFSIDDYK